MLIQINTLSSRKLEISSSSQSVEITSSSSSTRVPDDPHDGLVTEFQSVNWFWFTFFSFSYKNCFELLGNQASSTNGCLPIS